MACHFIPYWLAFWFSEFIYIWKKLFILFVPWLIYILGYLKAPSQPCRNVWTNLNEQRTTKPTMTCATSEDFADRMCLLKLNWVFAGYTGLIDFAVRWLIGTQGCITKTCLYIFDPLKPHFYIVKLGFTGVYIIFLIFYQKQLLVLVRTASQRRF